MVVVLGGWRCSEQITRKTKPQTKVAKSKHQEIQICALKILTSGYFCLQVQGQCNYIDLVDKEQYFILEEESVSCALFLLGNCSPVKHFFCTGLITYHVTYPLQD